MQISLSHYRVHYTAEVVSKYISKVRHSFNTVHFKNYVMTAPYLGDCSARNSYDELRDNQEIVKSELVEYNS